MTFIVSAACIVHIDHFDIVKAMWSYLTHVQGRAVIINAPKPAFRRLLCHEALPSFFALCIYLASCVALDAR
jgi:hypothetical protein